RSARERSAAGASARAPTPQGNRLPRGGNFLSSPLADIGRKSIQLRCLRSVGPSHDVATSFRLVSARGETRAMTHGRLELRGDAFVVTDPHRRLHGDTGPTKAEILAYYLKVAPRIMPFLRGRPVSTVWIPDDSTQESRFLRLAPSGFA